MKRIESRIHVVQKVNQLLTSAISTGVSDIHFEPFEVALGVILIDEFNDE